MGSFLMTILRRAIMEYTSGDMWIKMVVWGFREFNMAFNFFTCHVHEGQ